MALSGRVNPLMDPGVRFRSENVGLVRVPNRPKLSDIWSSLALPSTGGGGEGIFGYRSWCLHLFSSSRTYLSASPSPGPLHRVHYATFCGGDGSLSAIQVCLHNVNWETRNILYWVTLEAVGMAVGVLAFECFCLSSFWTLLLFELTAV